MILLNLSSHDVDQSVLQALESEREKIDRLISIPVDFDTNKSYQSQVIELLNRAGLTLKEWRNARLIILLPGQSSIAAVFLAEFHGRTGIFPTILRLAKMRRRYIQSL